MSVRNRFTIEIYRSMHTFLARVATEDSEYRKLENKLRDIEDG